MLAGVANVSASLRERRLRSCDKGRGKPNWESVREDRRMRVIGSSGERMMKKKIALSYWGHRPRILPAVFTTLDIIIIASCCAPFFKENLFIAFHSGMKKKNTPHPSHTASIAANSPITPTECKQY